MQVDISDKSRWWQRLLAAFSFFTRLPLWRLSPLPREAYERVVEWWPLTGWLTGSLMAATIYFGSLLLPPPLPVMVAIGLRIMLTGALHEDGLADFFDGFGGGGRDRERILSIMKDSRIGTYGVLALAIYLMLLFLALSSMTPLMAALSILVADPMAKMIAAEIIMMMPYARRREEAKSGIVYRRMPIASTIVLAIQGLAPFVAYAWLVLGPRAIRWDLIVFVPCIVMYVLYMIIWKRLRGYTGDCCGAVCLMVELSMLLAIAASLNISAQWT